MNRSDLPSLAYTSRFMTLPNAPIPPKPKPKHPRPLASWAAEALVYWPANKDITADALAERTGRPLNSCIRELTRATTEGWTRRTDTGGGRATTIWERTKVKTTAEVNASTRPIAEMDPGRRFASRELAMPNSTRSKVMRIAREMGLIRPVGVEAPKRATYRKVSHYS